MSKRFLTALWWAVFAFLSSAVVTTQVLAYQERHRFDKPQPLASPLVSPIEKPHIHFYIESTSGGTQKKETQTISQTDTPTPSPTATSLPIMPETGGDLIDATK